MRFEITLPWPPAELSPNSRTHHMVRARIVKKTRAESYALTRVALAQAGSSAQMALKEIIDSGASIAFWIDFYPPSRRQYDDDNLIARFKSARDGIAQALGINDRKFRTIPFVRSETHLGGKVVVVITELPALQDQREACAVSVGKEKPASTLRQQLGG